MIHWTNDDAQMLAHVADAMNDQILGNGTYSDEDEATMTKLEELAKAGPAVTVTGEALDPAAERELFRQIVESELNNWVPGASQRLIFRASRALGMGGVPDTSYAHSQDCGPERRSHALAPNWVAGVYVYQCVSCFRLYRA